jgi:hypothetical protein
LFGLSLEKLWEMQNKKGAIKTYHAEMAKLQIEYPDIEIFMKRKEKYCSEKVKALLFDKTLSKIYNERNGIQTITSFFVK